MIIEDDKDLSAVTALFLKNEGFDVIQAYDGKEGLDLLASSKVNLVILDIMLPNQDGIAVCQKIRENNQVPIIITSSKKTDYDKVLALGVGADDYMTKPFSQIELVARVKSHLRRCTEFTSESGNHEQKDTSRMIQVGQLCIYQDNYKVTVEGNDIEFSPKEFELLAFLASHPNQVFSKEQLMNQVWGYAEYLDTNTIAVYIGRIREKLVQNGVDCIKTVWGVGYRWES